MKRLMLFAMLIVVAALVFGAAPIHAQDGAPTAAPTIAPTAEPPVTTPATSTADTQVAINAILPIVVAVLFSFVAGGTTIAALLVLVLSMLLKSPVLLSILEKLYSGLSPDWKTAVKDFGTLVDEVTDDVPATGKTLAVGTSAGGATIQTDTIHSFTPTDTQ